jgi:PleD family two-component response regulator
VGDRVVLKPVESLILLDLGLAGMSGLDVLAALRTDVSTADVPIVVLSDRHDSDLLARAFGLGAIDYLIKTHTTPARVSHSVPTWVATQPARPMSFPIAAVAQAVATGANGSGE